MIGLRCLGLALIVLPCLGAASAIGYRVAQWRGNSEAARCVATNAHASNVERVQALEGLRRDAAMTIAVLRQMAEEHGELGAQARNALDHLLTRLR
jgi:hypothetical protein